MPKSTGLPLCYLCSLGTIHFLGAWISTLPSAPAENRTVVALGFRECSYGVVAFALGVFLAEKWAVNRVDSRVPWQSARVFEGRSPSAAFYVLPGLLCSLAFPFMSSIPSIAAVVHCGAYLTVVGFCLGIFRALQNGNRATTYFWLGATCVFPLFTILTAGFLGYGVFACLMVLCFASIHFRPRYQVFLGLCLMGYLGISFYVSYMRERDELRETVWGGQGYAARLEKLNQMFSRFEFFRSGDEEHVQTIDDRLNQNYLVGAAYVHIEFGLVPLAHGSTLWKAVLAIIPRVFWPGKPIVAGSGNIVSEYTVISFAENTSVGVGQVLEFYINFGRWGVVLGFFCFGEILRLIDFQAALRLELGDAAGFATWYLPGLAFLQTGGSLVEVAGTCCASIVVMIIMNRSLNRFG